MSGVRERTSRARDRGADAEQSRSGAGDREPKLTWFQAPPDRPSIDVEKARSVSFRDLLLRFAFGAGTSAIAGVVAVVWNARVAGIMLAFPAILAASLTLIADEESRRAAREDARGAVVAAAAIAAFAIVGYFAFGHVLPGLVLVLALVAWVVVAGGGYFLLWGPSHGLLRRR